MSLARNLASLGQKMRPLDFTTPQGAKLRLAVAENASDKFTTYGVDVVHELELEAVRKCAASLEEPLVFFDVGANSGLYTIHTRLGLSDISTVSEKSTWLCIEPNPEMLMRLTANLSFNGFTDTKILVYGVSDKAETAVLDIGVAANNLGQASLVTDMETANTPLAIKTTTLQTIIDDLGAGTPHIIKVDIEGHEITMFDYYWKECGSNKPKLIIVEMWDN